MLLRLYCPFSSTGATHLKLLDSLVSDARFIPGGVFECDIAHRRYVAVQGMLYKIGLTRYTLAMVLYLCRMCQCGLHALLQSHIGILMPLLAPEPRSTAGFSSEYPCGKILLTLYLMVSELRVWRAVPMFFYWPKLLDPFLSFTHFPFLYFLDIGWYCGTGVFWLLGCKSLSVILALPTSFNNNKITIELPWVIVFSWRCFRVQSYPSTIFGSTVVQAIWDQK